MNKLNIIWSKDQREIYSYKIYKHKSNMTHIDIILVALTLIGILDFGSAAYYEDNWYINDHADYEHWKRVAKVGYIVGILILVAITWCTRSCLINRCCTREEPGAVLVNVSTQPPPNTVAVTQIATAPINPNYPQQILIRQPLRNQSHAPRLNTINGYAHEGNNVTYFDAPPPYPGLPTNR